jgi:hypothetical protein
MAAVNENDFNFGQFGSLKSPSGFDAYDQQKPEENSTWSDVGSAAAAGGRELQAGFAAGARYFSNLIGDEAGAETFGHMQKAANLRAEGNKLDMSDAGRKQLEESVLSGDFWSHPFSSGMIKAANLSPSLAAQLAASAIPGGVVLKSLAAAGAGGAINADQLLNDISSQIDNMPDADLQKQSSLYRDLRTSFDEATAREQYNTTMQGTLAPAMNFLVGAGAASLGLAGSAARGGVAGAAEKGLLGRVGMGAAEGAGGMAAQNVVGDVTTQYALQDALGKPYDPMQTLHAGAEGAAMGGALGAIGGIPGREAARPSGGEDAARPAGQPSGGGGPGGAGRPGEQLEMDLQGGGQRRPAVDPNGQGQLPFDNDVSASREPTETDKAQISKGTVAPRSGGHDIANQPLKDEAIVGDAQNKPVRDQNGDKTKWAKKKVETQGELFADPKGLDDALEAALSTEAPATPESNAPAEQPASTPEAPAAQARPTVAPSPEDMAAHAPVAPRQPVIERVPEGKRKIDEIRRRRAEELYGRSPAEEQTGRVQERPAEQPLTDEETRGTTLEEMKRGADVADRTMQYLSAADQPGGVAKAIKKNRQDEARVKYEEKNPGRSRAGAEKIEKTTADREASQKIVDDHAPVEGETPEQQYARAKSMVDRANAEGVEIPKSLRDTKTGELAHPRQMIALREAADFVKTYENAKTRKGQTRAQARAEAAQRFYDREATARNGTDEQLRDVIGERRNEGDTAKRAHQGSVEELAEGAAEALPGNAVRTRTPRAKKEAQPVTPREQVEGRGEAAQVGTGAPAGANNQAQTHNTPVSNTVKKPLNKGLQKIQENRAKRAAEKAAAEAQSKPANPREEVTSKSKPAEPTEAQKEAGNYQKGHVKFQGLDISIETAKGQTRSGKDAAGKEWSVEMPHDYGYIKRTEGADGDHVDVAIGPHKDSERVYVINQKDPKTGKFDEHKALVGYNSADEAIAAYKKSFSDNSGASRIDSYAAMGMDGFKHWLKEGDTKKPIEAGWGSERKASRELHTNQGKLDLQRSEKLGYRGTRHFFDVKDADGKSVGKLQLREKGDQLLVDNVEGAGLTQRSIRDYLGQIKDRFPEARTISGLRGNTGDIRTVVVPIRRASRTDMGLLKEIMAKVTGQMDREPKGITTVKTLLSKNITLDGLDGVPKAVQKHLQKQLIDAAGDTRVYTVAPGERGYQELQKLNAYGVARFTQEGRRYIVLDKELWNNDTSAAHIAMHEVIHDFTERALTENKAIYDAASALHKEVLDYIKTLNGDDRNLHKSIPDVYEFMSEAGSNWRIQEMLHGMTVSDSLAKRLDLGTNRRSAWDAIVDVVRRAISYVTGRAAGPKTAIEAYLRIMENIEPGRKADKAGTPRNRGDWAIDDAIARGAPRDMHEAFVKPVGDRIESLKNGVAGWDLRNKGHALANALTTFHEFAAKNEHLIPLAKDAATMAERRTIYRQQEAKEGHDLAVEAMRLRDADPVNFSKYSDLLNEQTRYGIRADKPLEGLSIENQKRVTAGTFEPHMAGMNTWVEREVHADLKRQYDEVVAKQPALKGLMERTFDFTKQEQVAKSQENIRAILSDSSVSMDAAERGRLVNALSAPRVGSELLDEVKGKFGSNIADEIVAARKQLTGDVPYFPLKRYGDLVIGGTYKLNTEPTKALRETNGKTGHQADTWDFGSRKDAHEFVAQHKEFNPATSIKYYDVATGERLDATSAKSRPDEEVREVYQVHLDRRHVEMAETEHEAHQRREELAQSGRFTRDLYVQPKHQYENEQTVITKGTIQSAIERLKKEPGYIKADAEGKRDQEQSIRTAMQKTLVGHKIHGASLPRKGIRGASDDSIRSLIQFADMSAADRARIRFTPKIDDIVQKSEQWVKQQSYDKEGRIDPQDEARHHALEELRKRAYDTESSDKGLWTSVGRGIMAASYVDRLMRPSYLILHQFHNPMVTVPHLAGRHGVFASAKEMARNMRALSGFYGKGFEDMRGAFKDSLHKGTDFVQMTKDVFKNAADSKRLGRMLDELSSEGIIHAQAGFEVGRAMNGGVLQKIDGTFRAVTDAFESLNRNSAAVTAYRLEYQKLLGKVSADEAHVGAVKYAKDTLYRTEGNYSFTNAAPLFKNRTLRPFLQFRQFPMLMYKLLAHHTIQAFKGDTREARLEAAKSLGLIIATHVALAGAFGGLPTEGPKLIGAIIKGLHLTETDWFDVERSLHEMAVNKFGKTAADVMLHGAGGANPIAEFGTRVGMADLLLGISFPQGKDVHDAAKWGNWLSDMAFGAPKGLVTDAVTGVQNIADGKIADGVAKMVPMQAVRDALLAIQGERSNGQLKYSMTDRITRALGFTPAKEADFFSRRREQKVLKDEYQDQRQKIIYGMLDAKTYGDKVKAIQRIKSFNLNKPYDAQITQQALESAARSRSETGEDSKHHLFTSFGKTTNWIMQRDKQLYNQ